MVDRLNPLAGLRDGTGVLHVSLEPTDTVKRQALGFAAAEHANLFSTCDQLFDEDMAQKAAASGNQVAHANVLLSDDCSAERNIFGAEVAMPSFRAAQAANFSRLIFTL